MPLASDLYDTEARFHPQTEEVAKLQNRAVNNLMEKDIPGGLSAVPTVFGAVSVLSQGQRHRALGIKGS